MGINVESVAQFWALSIGATITCSRWT